MVSLRVESLVTRRGGGPGSLGMELLEYRVEGGGRVRLELGECRVDLSSSSSRGGGSCSTEVVAALPGARGGLDAGDTNGEVWSA